jgi:uncharacterized protein Yka (UPF0111/DUF47 family)
MLEKARIVEALGEQGVLLPFVLNEALSANDRAKYYFTLLQAARARADSPEQTFSDLRAERLACGIPDPSLDEVVHGSVRREPGTYMIPKVREICSSLLEDTKAMILPFERRRTTEANSFTQRMHVFSGAPWYGVDGSMTGEMIAALTSGEHSLGDSLHLLIMDMHKALNKLQAEISTEFIDGASSYALQPADRPLVAAFMKGVSRTQSLRFDHPGLGTTATRTGGRLIIQNDIGNTDAHVLVIHVKGRQATVTYTDTHLPRLIFFKEMFAGWTVAWEEVHSRSDPSFEGGVYHMCMGVFNAKNSADLKAWLTHLGSRLVFLIDWNRARKCLQLMVPRQEALSLLSWAEKKDIGHMAFLKAGGQKMIFDALRFAAGGAFISTTRFDEMLGCKAAESFLRFVLTTCCTGMIEKRPINLIHDEVRVELLGYFHSAQGNLLDLASEQAALAVEIATNLRDELLSVPDNRSCERFARIGRHAKEWEHKADELVNHARELSRRSERAGAIREIIENADEIIDELEEAAFHLTLLSPDGMEDAIRLPLAALARLLVEGTQEYLKAIENARGIEGCGFSEDIRDLLAAIHRVVLIERQSDTAEREVRRAILTRSKDLRQVFVVTECAKNLETAADELMHASLTLRHHMLDHIAGS